MIIGIWCIISHKFVCVSLQGHQGPQGPMGPPGPKGEKVHLLYFMCNTALLLYVECLSPLAVYIPAPAWICLKSPKSGSITPNIVLIPQCLHQRQHVVYISWLLFYTNGRENWFMHVGRLLLWQNIIMSREHDLREGIHKVHFPTIETLYKTFNITVGF